MSRLWCYHRCQELQQKGTRGIHMVSQTWQLEGRLPLHLQRRLPSWPGHLASSSACRSSIVRWRRAHPAARPLPPSESMSFPNRTNPCLIFCIQILLHNPNTPDTSLSAFVSPTKTAEVKGFSRQRRAWSPYLERSKMAASSFEFCDAGAPD